MALSSGCLHRCPPYNSCYGSYQYCSLSSRAVEPCVSGILGNYTARSDLCWDIITGVKNESHIFVYDKSCNLKADCFSEFGDKFTCSAESEPQKNIPEADCFWKGVAVAALVVIILLSAVIVGILVYFRRELKKKDEKIADLEKKMKLRTDGNRLWGVTDSNDRPPSMIAQNRIIFDEAAPNSESNEPLLSRLRDGVDGELSHESMALTSVTVHNLPPVSTTSPSVLSPNIAQSNESLIDSTASGGSQHNEESQSTSTTSNEQVNYNHHGHPAETDNHQNQRSFHTSNEHDNNNHHGHPAETDNQNQRSIHMPSTEPSDHQITVVTSMSSVHHPE